MNFKGDEGRHLAFDGTDDGYFYDLLKEAARISKPGSKVTIVCQTENIEIVSRVRRRVQAEGQYAQGLVGPKPPSPGVESCGG
jgi:dihydropyrimidinase